MARTISSPGVQITEKDLSLRVDTQAGTTVLVTGFAPQGPTSEPIMISTMSEFETIFGSPVTPAERYFYYSCKEVLNSQASLLAIRLPYGSESGVSFGKNYSALIYPINLLNSIFIGFSYFYTVSIFTGLIMSRHV